MNIYDELSFTQMAFVKNILETCEQNMLVNLEPDITTFNMFRYLATYTWVQLVYIFFAKLECPFLKIGATEVFFQSDGSLPESNGVAKNSAEESFRTL